MLPRMPSVPMPGSRTPSRTVSTTQESTQSQDEALVLVDISFGLMWMSEQGNWNWRWGGELFTFVLHSIYINSTIILFRNMNDGGGMQLLPKICCLLSVSRSLSNQCNGQVCKNGAVQINNGVCPCLNLSWTDKQSSNEYFLYLSYLSKNTRNLDWTSNEYY